MAGKPLHIVLDPWHCKATCSRRCFAKLLWESLTVQEDEEGLSHDIDETEEVPKGKDYPDRKVDGIEMCQDRPIMDACMGLVGSRHVHTHTTFVFKALQE